LFFLCFIFLQLLLCAYDLDKHQTMYNTCGSNKRIYEQICIQIYIYLYLWFLAYWYIWESIVVWKNRTLYEVCCLSNNKDYVSQLRSDYPVEL
jgi:hypothetical protein